MAVDEAGDHGARRRRRSARRRPGRRRHHRPRPRPRRRARPRRRREPDAPHPSSRAGRCRSRAQRSWQHRSDRVGETGSDVAERMRAVGHHASPADDDIGDVGGGCREPELVEPGAGRARCGRAHRDEVADRARPRVRPASRGCGIRSRVAASSSSAGTKAPRAPVTSRSCPSSARSSSNGSTTAC